MTSALTVPEGHVEVAGRGMLLLGGLGEISAGLTSSTEIWADYGKLFTFNDEGDSTATYGFGAKQVLAHDRTRQVAITGSLRRLDGEMLFAGSAMASFCSDTTCDTMFTLGAGIAAANNHTVPVASGSILTGSGAFHGMVEAMWLDQAGLGVLGMRIGGANVAFDIGMGIALSSSPPVMLPIAGLAARM